MIQTILGFRVDKKISIPPEVKLMSRKRYEIKTSCPHCGCSALSHLSHEEMMERYGDVPNVELECSECMVKFKTDMKEACPIWEKECQLKE